MCDLLRAFPEAAVVPNKDGSLPLHLAVANNHASPEVVQKLLQAYPKGPRTADSVGNLPLHEACAWQAPFDVVLLLIQAFPEAVSRPRQLDQALPLHLACTVTPTTFCADNKLCFAVIWNLLEQWPDAVMSRNAAGDTPYDILRRGAPQQAELLQLLRTKRAWAQMPVRRRQQQQQERQQPFASLRSRPRLDLNNNNNNSTQRRRRASLGNWPNGSSNSLAEQPIVDSSTAVTGGSRDSTASTPWDPPKMRTTRRQKKLRQKMLAKESEIEI